MTPAQGSSRLCGLHTSFLPLPYTSCLRACRFHFTMYCTKPCCTTPGTFSRNSAVNPDCGVKHPRGLLLSHLKYSFAKAFILYMTPCPLQESLDTRISSVDSLACPWRCTLACPAAVSDWTKALRRISCIKFGRSMVKCAWFAPCGHHCDFSCSQNLIGTWVSYLELLTITPVFKRKNITVIFTKEMQPRRTLTTDGGLNAQM